MNLKSLFTRRPVSKKMIDKLYRTIDGTYISRTERERFGINDTSFIYGEITYPGFSEILSLVHRDKDKVFYDLGSGVGKAVFCAALLYDWEKCVGIESLPGLYLVSQELLKNFSKMPEIQIHYPNKKFPIEFIEADFLTVDFSDADIIFVNATTLNAVLWHDLEMKLNRVNPGTRIIVCTRKLDPCHFEIIHLGMYPMSWGDCTVFIYQRNETM